MQASTRLANLKIGLASSKSLSLNSINSWIQVLTRNAQIEPVGGNNQQETNS